MPTLPKAFIILSMLVALYASHAIPVASPQSSIRPVTMSPAGDFQMQIQPNQFLMRNGTSATPSIVFTTNGFTGQVSITLSVSPNIPNAPTAFFNYPIVTLNASMGGSPGYPLEINTTTNTPTGLYMVTATGRSGLLVHTGNATIGVTNAFIPGNGAELVYKLNFDNTQPHPGDTIYFIGNFSDLGYVSIMVNTITVQFSFGTYGGYRGQGLLLEPYMKGIFSFAVTIPTNTTPGFYPYTATISWDLGPYTISQTQQPDIVTHNSLQVYPNTSALPNIPFPIPTSFLLPAIILESLVSAFSIILVHRNENLKRARLRITASRI